MSAGKRNERITIEEPLRADADGDGQEEITWQPYGSFWAEVIQTGGGQSAEFGERQQQAEHREMFDLFSSSESRAITEDMRIVHRGRTLEIDNVHVDWSQRKAVVVTATEKPRTLNE